MADSIQALLGRASANLALHSESAQLDAEVLLAHCLGKNRTYLRTWPERQPNDQQCQQFWALVEQRQLGTPIAYLTGEREFWSRRFQVNPQVLIPRPDSELLIELSLARLPSSKTCRVIDLGTGSGILAITLAAELPNAEIVACDLSLAALEVAKHNARQLGITNVTFKHSDWFAQIQGDFDLIVSNPPYIADDDPHLQQGDVRFEPNSALVSSENGLRDIRQISQQARNHLKPDGWLLVEHGYQQASDTQNCFKALNYQHIETYHDLSGNPRVTCGLWNPL